MLIFLHQDKTRRKKMPNHHLLCILSPSLSLFFFFSFFASFHGGHSNFSPDCDPDVPPFLCGGFEIRFPFWNVTSDADVHCGYPGFGLHCPYGSVHPTLSLSGDSYYVTGINYDDKTLTLVDIDFVTDQGCPRARHNLKLESLPLEYNHSNVNLTFFFNCTAPLALAASIPALAIDCLKSGDNRTYVLVNNSPEEVAAFEKELRCEDAVVVAVKRTDVTMGNVLEEFAEAMREGFVLDWGTSKDCRKCEHSGRRCAVDEHEQLVCLCDDEKTHTGVSFCKGNKKIALKVGIAFAGVAGGIAVMMIVYFYKSHQRKKSEQSFFVSRSMSSVDSSRTDFEKGSVYYGIPVFDYEELRKATNDFDPAAELGDGGFGTVFKGKLRDGRVVAVKRLYESNYKRVEQFMNEIKILTHLRHPNLVSLYGCTSRQSQRLLLVYEYVPNGTVADHIHGELAKPGLPPWSTRLNIAMETANALVYLHASVVIHRDVKTNNILLDENFSVKVADFGLSRLFPLNVTHVSTAPQGTPGYVDPEYHQCYQLTEKSDVYSFGVVLMELISSLPAVDITRHRHEINLSALAMDKIRSHALHELVDRNLGFDTDYRTRKMITAVAELGFQCLQEDHDMRPSMVEVWETLKDIQNRGHDMEKSDETDNPAEDAVLLKNNPLTLSPDSVTVKWVSTDDTPHASS
ncbi:LEAF RUST 10 DISEASE-RESISTANCE LOCUS RECEPTOR-LIKE PROTEIN KINASE-like 1.2 isoform X1 [Rhodamnia argentea]|uniref:non-specific serine/threonine protein kinase n=1 Tax=Rhodamnia argentea TaxID=178133 RepID=A0ABM3HJS5_9MYRT|nr:LEAF RUST 10 DISEASE-RESISTANCE LOCUS RECEPTOR-LIKE PROTEIN KINASE-like 1.2 isoform X1 [Rhodamnia argentea]